MQRVDDLRIARSDEGQWGAEKSSACLSLDPDDRADRPSTRLYHTCRRARTRPVFSMKWRGRGGQS